MVPVFLKHHITIESEQFAGSAPAEEAKDQTYLKARGSLDEDLAPTDTKEEHRTAIKTSSLVAGTVKGWEEAYCNEVFCQILKRGSRHLDFLRRIDIESLTMKEKANYLEKLFTVLTDGKSKEENKYNKLLDLHNGLIEVNSKNEKLYSPQKMLELEDGNSKLRQEIRVIQGDYE